MYSYIESTASGERNYAPETFKSPYRVTNGENDPAYNNIVIEIKENRDALRMAWAQCGSNGHMRTRFEMYQTGPFNSDESENGGLQEDVKSIIRSTETDVTYVWIYNFAK